MKLVVSITGVSVAAAIGAFALGCATEPRAVSTPAAREYPGTLVLPSAVPGDFMARQQVKARYGETRVQFRSVLQKRGDTLTLLGLTPFGTRAFLLQQEGTAVTFTSYVDRVFPFPSHYLLLDIQRALFIGIGSGPLPDGVHTASRDGEEIRERWHGGRIMERTFRRETGQPPGSITITCKDGMVYGVPPAKLKFRNGWFGYELTITTLSYESLEPHGEPADDER